MQPEDETYECFRLYYNLTNPQDNNIGELNNKYEEGWKPDFMSDEIVHNQVVHMFLMLVKGTFK